MSVCDIPVISNVCDAVGEGTASRIAAPFDWLASSMAGAAAWLMETMWTVFDTTTLVDLTQPGFVSVYNLLFGIALFIVAIFFFLQLITGMIPTATPPPCPAPPSERANRSSDRSWSSR